MLTSFLLLVSLRQSDPGADIQSLIRNQSLGSPEFQRSVSEVFGRYGIAKGKFESKKTIGDSRGIIVTAINLESQYPIVWRVLVWPEGTINRAQLLRKTALYSGDGFTDGEVYWRGDRMAVAGWRVNGGNGERASLDSYRLVNGTWRMVQHLQDQREGSAKFARNAKAVDPNLVLVTTREWTKNLEQPHVGPLLQYAATWKYVGGMYRRGPARKLYTPVAELDQLAGLVLAKDRANFDLRVPTEFRERFWAALAKYSSVRGVGNDFSDTPRRFRFGQTGPEFEMSLINGRWTPVAWSDKPTSKGT